MNIFPEPLDTSAYCENYVRMLPRVGEEKHISDIVDAYFGYYNEFDWQLLAHNPPPILPGFQEVEEADSMIAFTFPTEDSPALNFVARIARKYPTLDIVHDYQMEANEYLGRVWYKSGSIYKECHLTPIPGPYRW